MRKEDCCGRVEVQIRHCIHDGETQNGSDSSFFSSIIPGLVRAVMAPSCSAFSVPPCIGGFTCVGHGWILLFTLPHFQGGIPILTIKQRLSFVFIAPGHPQLSCALSPRLLLLSNACALMGLATNFRAIPLGSCELLHLPCVVLAAMFLLL